MISALRWIALQLGWLAAFAGPLAAAEYHVEHPRQIAAAAKKAQPGDVIVLADGSYRSTEIVFDAQGTAERPIVLRAATPGKVLLGGSSCLRIGGSYLVVEGLYFWSAFHPEGLIIFRRNSRHEAQHCRVTQCGVIDCNPGREEVDSSWVVMFGSYNRVDHCVLQGKTNSGPELDVWIPEDQKEPNFHQIDHNYFGPRPPLERTASGAVLRVGEGTVLGLATRIAVEANLFDRCTGGSDVVDNRGSEVAFRGNTFMRSTGSLALRACKRCRVTDNYFIGTNTFNSGGVRISGDEHNVASNYFYSLLGDHELAAVALMDGYSRPQVNGYYPTRKCMVVGNMMIYCEHPLAIGAAERERRRVAGDRLPPQDCTVAENVVLNARGTIVEQQSAGEHIASRGNLYSGGDLGIGRSPDAWTQAMIPLGERAGLPWPQQPAGVGPKLPPVQSGDVGAIWFSLAP